MARAVLLRPSFLIAVSIMAAALLLRLPDVGNPRLDLDEQMYLLVGDRMWQGLIPYVDVWDRKPIGLFLVYALARAPGGDPYVGYQLLALAAATATALIAARLARLAGGNGRAALAAGFVYLVWLALAGGRGGQSPVYYNLPTALAALIVARAWRDERVHWAAPTAMLLVGIAIQIKPTVVFEGGWFAVLLLARAWRRGGTAAVPREALLLAGAALLSTLLAFTVYIAIGHGHDWWFANVRSIFLRGVATDEPIAARLGSLALAFAAPVAVALAGLASLRPPIRVALGGWLAAALVGFLAVPPYYNHYALPVVLPLSVLAGVGAGQSRPMAAVLAAAALGLLAFAGLPAFGTTPAARAQVERAARMINGYRRDGCLYLFQAEPVLYTATGSCLPTRYPFPPHLTFGPEAGAIGTAPADEVARIIATHPPVVVSLPPSPGQGAPSAIAARALARNYRRVGTALGYVVYAVNRQAPAAPVPAPASPR